MPDEITLRDEECPSERPAVVACKRVDLKEPPPIVTRGAGPESMMSLQPVTLRAFGLPPDFDLQREWSHVAYGGREWAIKSASIIGRPQLNGSLDLHFALDRRST